MIRALLLLRAIILYGIIVSPVPVAGIVVGGGALVLAHMEETIGAPGTPRWSEVCIPGDLPEVDSERRGCLSYLAGMLAYRLSVTVAAIVAVQTAFLLLAAAWTRRDPFRMAECFGWLSGVFVTLWSLLAIPQFMIVLAITFMTIQIMERQSAAIEAQVVFFALLCVPAAFLAVFRFGAVFRFWRRPEFSVGLGCAVGRDEAPELYEFVENVARSIGVAPPAWLAVNIDTDFSITDAPVRLPDLDEPLGGGVMSLSLPLLRVLTAEETVGIVAHELGHMADPISRAKSSWAHAGDSIGRKPLKWHLGLLPALFAWAVAETLHRGEANADNATLRVARPEAAVLAFLKALVTEEALSDHASINFDRLEKGVVLDNLSIEAADLARKALADVDPGELAAKIRYECWGDSMEPSVEQRIGNFGITLVDATELMAGHTGRGELAKVGDLTRLEERASRNVHRFQQVLAGYPGPLTPKEVESMAAFLGN
jgi:Zn-dependent protease with chaperone function